MAKGVIEFDKYTTDLIYKELNRRIIKRIFIKEGE